MMLVVKTGEPSPGVSIGPLISKKTMTARNKERRTACVDSEKMILGTKRAESSPCVSTEGTLSHSLRKAMDDPSPGA